MENEPDDAELARFMVLYPYGEIMLGFQLLELDFWALLTVQQKEGMTLDQRMGKVESWDRGANMGRLLGGIRDMPDDLREECERAVDARNYLAHRWLRERAMFFTQPNANAVFREELADISLRMQGLDDAIEAFKRERGIPDLTDDELEDLGLEEPPDFDSWMRAFSLPDEESPQ